MKVIARINNFRSIVEISDTELGVICDQDFSNAGRRPETGHEFPVGEKWNQMREAFQSMREIERMSENLRSFADLLDTQRIKLEKPKED